MTHGLQFFNASGQLILEDDETFARVVHSQRFASNFTGTIIVPEFDDTKGIFYISYYAMKFRSDVDTQMADNTAWNVYDYLNIRLTSFTLPSLYWSNGPRTMDISPHSIPSGWHIRGNLNPDYELTFIHYR
jgi:hypothetical protein